MMVDPFGDEPTRFAQRGLGMMDAIQGRAGDERRHVIRAALPEFGIGGDHGCLTTAGDLADMTHPGTLLIANGSQLRSRVAR